MHHKTELVTVQKMTALLMPTEYELVLGAIALNKFCDPSTSVRFAMKINDCVNGRCDKALYLFS